MLKAEIVAIGSELLTPHRTDTNSLWLTERLNSVGIAVQLKTIVGDDEPRLEEAIRDALSRSDVVVLTGGLGPTEDDVTRKVFSRVTGRQLTLDYEVLEQIRARITRRGYQMTPNNERQALIPRGASVLPNPNGTAPGMKADENGKLVVLLPGPPRENQPMFDNYIMPDLEKMSRGVRIAKRVLKVTGIGESQLDDVIAPIYSQYTNPTTTILFTDSEIEIHLTATAESLSRAGAVVDELTEKLEERLGIILYSTTGESLESVVGQRLRLKHYTIATAESCTGGLLAQRMTEVPGSSDYYVGGVVSYTNEAKIQWLGVPRETIERLGPVSGEVAEAMARGTREISGATIGVSITGIAGPGGGSEAVPVGTVYIGLANETGSTNKRVILPGDRHLVRWRASTSALELVRRSYLV
ncbi:MAG TPA: competence/damage-inducible protein A [Blastocatellia bacterium]|jgi:nicotinamide-nucleotide amidase|nr:competence/damage-inducible protein A [Blastocatellia bacterium]